MALLCPLCSGLNFSSAETLLHSLISSSTQSIVCPLCSDVLRGLDKFTVHLCSHILIKRDPKPADLSLDSNITHIDKKFKNIRLNASSPPNHATVAKNVCFAKNSHTHLDEKFGNVLSNTSPSVSGVSLANNLTSSSENLENNKSPNDSTSKSLNLAVEETNGIMSDYLDSVSSIINGGCNYLNHNVSGGESEITDFPISLRPDEASISFSESLKPNSRGNSLSNSPSEITDDFISRIQCELTPKQTVSNFEPENSSNSSPCNFLFCAEFANLNSSQMLGSLEPDCNPVSNILADAGHSQCDILSQLESILNENDRCSLGLNPSQNVPEEVIPTKANDDDFSTKVDERDLPSNPMRNTTCNICFVSLPDEIGILSLHKELVHDKNAEKTNFKYSCTLCKRKFKIKGSLSIHLQVAHSDGKSKQMSPGQSTNDELQHRCNICSKMFKKEYLNQHLKTHEEKKWACDCCGKLFTTKYFLQKHKRLHTGEMPYVCPLCDRQFTFQQTYHKHLMYHNDEKPYSCKECGKSFKELSTLYNHQRIHSGEKPYSCDICGKSFRQRVSCIIHSRIHTGLEPFACHRCHKSFRYKISLKSHRCLQESTSV